jgi:hypothetical protein
VRRLNIVAFCARIQLERFYIGIDWSSKKHAVCFVNAAGAAIARRVIAHTPAGLAEFERQRERLGVEPAECVIGLETAHNLLVDSPSACGAITTLKCT